MVLNSGHIRLGYLLYIQGWLTKDIEVLKLSRILACHCLAREVVKQLPLLPEWTLVTSILDTLDDVAGDDAPELEKDDDNTDDILPHLQADDTAVNPLLFLLLVTSLVSTSSWLKHPANTRDIRIFLLSWSTSRRMTWVWGKDGLREQASKLVGVQSGHFIYVCSAAVQGTD